MSANIEFKVAKINGPMSPPTNAVTAMNGRISGEWFAGNQSGVNSRNMISRLPLMIAMTLHQISVIFLSSQRVTGMISASEPNRPITDRIGSSEICSVVKPQKCTPM